MRVTPSQARKHALFHLYTKARHTFNPFGTGSASLLTLGEGVDFFDVSYLENDAPPLRCFEIISGDSIVGIITVAGSTNLGSTLVELRITGAEPFGTRLQELRAILREFLGVDHGFLPDEKIYPVTYSFPKFGLGILQEDNVWVIVDYFEGLPFRAQIEEFEPDDPIQGIGVWSFWDAFPQAGSTDGAWRLESDFINSLLPTNERVWLAEAKPFTTLDLHISERPPMQRILSLPVPLIGQITNIHCAPASLSMIFEYLYRRPLLQEDAGEAMEILPSGSTISGQVSAFRAKLGTDFEVMLDRTPTWEEAHSAIKSGLPAKSGIRGHARAVVGVREDVYIDPITGQTQLTEQLLLVNDPEPVGKGSQIWENVKTALLRDFIFITRR